MHHTPAPHANTKALASSPGIHRHEHGRWKALASCATALLAAASLTACSHTSSGTAPPSTSTSTTPSPSTSTTTAETALSKDEVLCGVLPHGLLQDELDITISEDEWTEDPPDVDNDPPILKSDDVTWSDFSCTLPRSSVTSDAPQINSCHIDPEYPKLCENAREEQPDRWTSFTIDGREGQGWIIHDLNRTIWVYPDGRLLDFSVPLEYAPTREGMVNVTNHLIDTVPAFTENSGRDRSPAPSYGPTEPIGSDKDPLCGVLSTQALQEELAFTPTGREHHNWPPVSEFGGGDFECYLSSALSNQTLNVTYEKSDRTDYGGTGLAIDKAPNDPESWQPLDAQDREGQGWVWHDDRIIRVVWSYPDGNALDVRLENHAPASGIDQSTIDGLTSLTNSLIDTVPTYNQTAGNIRQMTD